MGNFMGFWVIFSGWVRQNSYFGSWAWLEVKTKTNFIELPRDLWNLSAAVQWVVHVFALLSSVPSSSAAASRSSTSMPAKQRLELRDGNLVKWNHPKFRTMQPGSNMFKYVPMKQQRLTTWNRSKGGRKLSGNVLEWGPLRIAALCTVLWVLSAAADYFATPSFRTMRQRALWPAWGGQWQDRVVLRKSWRS